MAQYAAPRQKPRNSFFGLGVAVALTIGQRRLPKAFVRLLVSGRYRFFAVLEPRKACTGGSPQKGR